jgi:hypothetical protein
MFGRNYWNFNSGNQTYLKIKPALQQDRQYREEYRQEFWIRSITSDPELRS